MNWINTVLLPIYSHLLQATCLIHGERKEYLSQQLVSPKNLYFQIPSFSFNFSCSLPCLTLCFVCFVSNRSFMSNSLQLCALWPTWLLCPWDSPGKNTGVGCHALLQGIFLTQGSNPHFLRLLHCRQILYRWATGKAGNMYCTVPLITVRENLLPQHHTLLWALYTYDFGKSSQ